ncbi:MAG: beta-phosphoglucomutase [Chloroflexi bacterium]|nr:beta-phosphoglucomutase [Chloroflexota bacterium]MCC6891642.1 glycoside hydrolase family 65 protein [Anaerolineae bacterium]
MTQKLWQIEEFPFHPERLNHYETLFTIGNGYLATRGSFEEAYKGGISTTMVHGIFDHAEGALVPELVNAPNWLPINITIDGTPFQLINQNDSTLKPKNGAVVGYRRILMLDKGILRREVLFRAESGSIVRLVFERFASLHDEHLMVQRLEITAVDGNPQIEIKSSIDSDVSNVGIKHWGDIQAEAGSSYTSVSAKTIQSGYGIAMASTLRATSNKANVEFTTRNGQPSANTHFQLQQEDSIEFLKLTSVYTSRDGDNPLQSAVAKLGEAASATYESLVTPHINEWATYWKTSDVQIEGDEGSQLAVRFTQYHILIAAPRHDDDVSIGAKTLSGTGYKGHVFWDTELFILPPLSLGQPKLARNLLMYRYHRLAGARNKAKANGYEGAMYPWESTDTGEETTPSWGDPQPDGSRIRIWTGDSEQHISTDIAYGILQYWRYSGDNNFLQQYGAEIVLDTAVFWGSRVEWKNERYELSQQIGPDEYHENIDNSVFTNRMTVWHLEQALALLEWLKTNAPADAERLTTQLDLTPKRLDHWRDVIAKMYIPFDEDKQIHVQFPGFFDLEYIPVPHYEPRTMSVQAILGHHRSIQTQVIKQADVVMMTALLGDELASKDVLMNNWNTYYPRTDHGSSLSPAIHAWVAARLGLDDLAYYLFEHAAEIDLKDNKGNVKDGIHGAASGGLWQALVFGFCGLHITPDGNVAVAPRLPKHWKQVSFTIYFKGKEQEFTITNTP